MPTQLTGSRKVNFKQREMVQIFVGLVSQSFGAASNTGVL